MRKIMMIVVTLTMLLVVCNAFAHAPLIQPVTDITLPEVQTQDSHTPSQNISDVSTHEHHYWKITFDATCTTHGYIEYRCNCGDIYRDPIEKYADHRYVVTVIPATCTQPGYTQHKCSVCQHTYIDNLTNPIPHHYGEWKVQLEATPIDPGTETRKCTVCHVTQTREYEFVFVDDDALFIPHAGIHTKLTIGELTQIYVDNYDTIYTEPIGKKDPVILGHNYRSLKHLHKTIVGQNIYVNLNGELRIYRVVVSELAKLNNNHSNMTGTITGHTLWDSVGDETLHMYTCHKDSNVYRWLVLAERVL